jgi:DNA-binding response OmpR family regulator
MDNTGQPATVPTVLVVDDNKGVLEFLLLLLSKHGLVAVGASSGGECLTIVKSRPVDLIVLDVMMPGMDGLQVARELKNITPTLPIILLTARDDMNTRAAAMELGVSEFVAKPVNNRDLLNRIRTQLRNVQWNNTASQVVSKIEKWSPTGKPVAPFNTPVGRNPEREPPAKAGARVEGPTEPPGKKK